MIDLNKARNLVEQESPLIIQQTQINAAKSAAEKELASLRNRSEVSNGQGGKPLSVVEANKLEILPARVAELAYHSENIAGLLAKVQDALKEFALLPEMKVKTMSEKANARKAQVVYVIETPQGKRSITLHLKLVNGKWTGKHPITGKQDTIFNL